KPETRRSLAGRIPRAQTPPWPLAPLTSESLPAQPAPTASSTWNVAVPPTGSDGAGPGQTGGELAWMDQLDRSQPRPWEDRP
ncbi:MAG: hypothetical protein LBE08_05980, partial [Bifidobacteriaceae bacterium]|nr:hypothetical protein [Bifidobacteriaceae bacterium]